MKKFVVLVISLFLFPKLYLAEENYFYLDPPIEGIYTMMDKVDKLAANYVKPVRKAGNNEYVYCVTPGIAINPSGNYTKVSNSPWNNLNISKEKYERMQIISYYGYLYVNHTDLKWYAITQYLIWQEVMPSGWSVYFTNTLRGEMSHDFDWMINELNSLVDNYYKNPNIPIEIEGNYKNDIILNDSNNVLNNYISSSNNVLINNNSLTLKPSNNNYSFSLNYNTDDRSSDLYVFNNAQWVMSRGSLPSKTINYNVTIPKGSLKIIKTIGNKDELDIYYNPSLEGAKYHVFNDYYDEIYETDSNGIINVSNLNIDSYYVKEVSAPKDFELDNNLYYLNITKNEQFNLKVYDDLKIGRINIFKRYLNTDTNTYEEEKNISFGILDENDKLLVTKKTDYNGFVSFNLPLKTYTLSQIDTLDGYDKIKNEEINLEIERFVSLTYYNRPQVRYSTSYDEESIIEEPVINEIIPDTNEEIINEPVVFLNNNFIEEKPTNEIENIDNPKTLDNIRNQLLFLGSSIIIIIANFLKNSTKKKEIKEK